MKRKRRRKWKGVEGVERGRLTRLRLRESRSGGSCEREEEGEGMRVSRYCLSIDQSGRRRG